MDKSAKIKKSRNAEMQNWSREQLADAIDSNLGAESQAGKAVFEDALTRLADITLWLFTSAGVYNDMLMGKRGLSSTDKETMASYAKIADTLNILCGTDSLSDQAKLKLMAYPIMADLCISSPKIAKLMLPKGKVAFWTLARTRKMSRYNVERGREKVPSRFGYVHSSSYGDLIKALYKASPEVWLTRVLEAPKAPTWIKELVAANINVKNPRFNEFVKCLFNFNKDNHGEYHFWAIQALYGRTDLPGSVVDRTIKSLDTGEWLGAACLVGLREWAATMDRSTAKKLTHSLAGVAAQIQNIETDKDVANGAIYNIQYHLAIIMMELASNPAVLNGQVDMSVILAVLDRKSLQHLAKRINDLCEFFLKDAQGENAAFKKTARTLDVVQGRIDGIGKVFTKSMHEIADKAPYILSLEYLVSAGDLDVMEHPTYEQCVFMLQNPNIVKLGLDRVGDMFFKYPKLIKHIERMGPSILELVPDAVKVLVSIT